MFIATSGSRFKYFVVDEWKDLKKCPKWYDKGTRGCSHPDGVLIAGSTRKKYAKKVAFMDQNKGDIVDLSDLRHPVTNVGKKYDDTTDMLTVAGGEIYGVSYDESNETHTGFQLPMS